MAITATGCKPQHSCAKKVAQFTEEFQITNLVLTHFSARYGLSSNHKLSIKDVKDEAKSNYSGNLFLANDLIRKPQLTLKSKIFIDITQAKKY